MSKKNRPKKIKTHKQSAFHRIQIGRAQKMMRAHYQDKLKLEDLAAVAGSSVYHFARVFWAYESETPFDFLKRLRLSHAVKQLAAHQFNPNKSITTIALECGYDTPSSFNKSFKKTLNLSPSEFRNLGKAQQKNILYALEKPPSFEKQKKEIPMTGLSYDYKIVERPTTNYAYLEDHGPFREVAPALWQKMFSILMPQLDPQNINEFLGLAAIEKTKDNEDLFIYRGGIGLKKAPDKKLNDVHFEKIPAGRYASFLYRGAYSKIWLAFDEAYKTLSEKNISLRQGFSIDKYLNNPETTPEEDLLTEILIPVQ